MANKKVYSLQFTVYSALFFLLLYTVHCTLYTVVAFAQPTDDLEFTFDINSSATPLPKIFKPNIDLSGRGFHHDASWPQVLAAEQALKKWQADIGFSGAYRLQYNLWEIHQLAKEKDMQDKLLSNYEKIMKEITDAGGLVILDIFGTPNGLGRVLDKRSPPWDLRAFKELVKGYMREFSCRKKYNIWYEVWSAPDLDDFFLARKQEYLGIYRAIAEAAKELGAETKIHIPVGGPSVSWWFQDLDGNTIITPEKSLIYELIKFCYARRLPLDFISWHGYSTSLYPEQEITAYKKTTVGLIRDWLAYFKFDRNTPLIVDEWNYDNGANILAERQESSYHCASYIPSRLKNMHKAGINYQFYFSLEDFSHNKEGVSRNVGIFWFSPEVSGYKGGPKTTYNIFQMLNKLGNEVLMPLVKRADEFVGVIATKSKDGMAMMIYNYIDPEIARSYLSRNIASLNNAERKILLNLIKTDKIKQVIRQDAAMNKLRLSSKLKTLLKKAGELDAQAEKFKNTNRKVKIQVKNLKENYLFQRYVIDSSCGLTCEFAPVEEKEAQAATEPYQEMLSLKPYSVQMIVLKKKAEEPAGSTVRPVEQTTPAQAK